MTITYYGQTISIPVTVSAKIPKKLEIYEEQNRRYTAGTRLDLSEVKVRITYSNGKNQHGLPKQNLISIRFILLKKQWTARALYQLKKRRH